ncbi:Alpha-mannosyltransferase [Phytophthora cactorum]|nr:Alpha-mannosyltransferase [Phytophthora cactorum]
MHDPPEGRISRYHVELVSRAGSDAPRRKDFDDAPRRSQTSAHRVKTRRNGWLYAIPLLLLGGLWYSVAVVPTNVEPNKEELSDNSISLLLAVDAKLEVVDVCSDLVQRGVITEDKARQFRSWWIKPLAMYHTDMKEVLLLDVDDIFMRDPAVQRILESRHNGTQYLRYLLDTFGYEKFGLPPGASPSSHLDPKISFVWTRQSSHEQDSSLVAIDKSRAGQAINVMFYLITEQRFIREFSYGDKETFWLSFELAKQEYFFSPWGVGDISSSTNGDMDKHSDSLCGSIVQYMPVEDSPPEFLYVNGKALLNPFPVPMEKLGTASRNVLFNTNPTHLTPRQKRRPNGSSKTDYKGGYAMECLIGFGASRSQTNLPRSCCADGCFTSVSEWKELPHSTRCRFPDVVVITYPVAGFDTKSTSPRGSSDKLFQLSNVVDLSWFGWFFVYAYVLFIFSFGRCATLKALVTMYGRPEDYTFSVKAAVMGLGLLEDFVCTTYFACALWLLDSFKQSITRRFGHKSRDHLSKAPLEPEEAQRSYVTAAFVVMETTLFAVVRMRAGWTDLTRWNPVKALLKSGRSLK